MRTRATDSLEGATMHHRAAMQSRIVARTLRTDNRRRQAASLRRAERQRLGRERERKRERSLKSHGLSPRRFRRVASRRNARGGWTATRVSPMRWRSATHMFTWIIFAYDSPTFRFLHVRTREKRLAASSSRSNRNRLTYEDIWSSRTGLSTRGSLSTSSAAAPAARNSPRETRDIGRWQAPWIVNYTISMTLAKFSRFVSLVDGVAHFQRQAVALLSRNFSRVTACHSAPWKLSICELVGSADEIQFDATISSITLIAKSYYYMFSIVLATETYLRTDILHSQRFCHVWYYRTYWNTKLQLQGFNIFVWPICQIL